MMPPTKQNQIAVIAESLGLPSLEIKISNPLDTYEVVIWKIKTALDAAYEAGYRAGVGAKRAVSGSRRGK